MPSLRDSDSAKWEYDLHTRIKHSILTDYLRPWLKILGGAGGSVIYVDAFAGRGRYNKGEPGSPLLVLDLIQAEMNRPSSPLTSVECHFVEPDPANFANLQVELGQHGASQDPRIKIRLYPSTFSAAGRGIITSIVATGRPSFIFLDPFGYDDPPMDLVGELLRLRRAEILVNIMYDFISRAIGISNNPTLAATLDRLFGTTDWRKLASLVGKERERAFVQLYRQQLKAIGAVFAVSFPMADDHRARTLYHLVHATGKPLGARIMKDIMVKVSTSGQLGFAGARLQGHHALFHADVDALPERLLNLFAGQSLTFDQIVDQTIEDIGTCVVSDYRSCLKTLEANDKVAITRVTSKRSGLDRLDLVTFPAR